MIPGKFEYHRPGDVGEAVALLQQHGEDGKVLAGGHSLIPMMKLRLAEPAHLIDLAGLGDLKGIDEDGGAIRIGAMVSQSEVISASLLAEKCPILPETARLISDPQVRNCGTVGGNVANGDPANDMPAVMMALGAEYVLRGPGGERTVAANEFYRGSFLTAMDATELLTEVRIPIPAAGHGYAYAKMTRKVGDYATAATAAILTLDGGACGAAAITLTNAGPTPLNAKAAADALVGTSVDDAAIASAAEAAAGIANPVSDLHGPAEFRKRMAGVMTRRAIEQALSRAKGG